VHRSVTPVQERQRVHVDLVVDSAADSTDADSVVLADTEGNRFCIVDAGRSANL
jgi:hypothetical protein